MPSDQTPSTVGLEEDAYCPGCGYNLRGLTVPRCPECGRPFTSAEIDEYKEPPPSSLQKWLVVTAFAIPAVVILVTSGAWVLILGAGLILLVGVPQAGFEYAATLVLIGPSSWRKFRAWWEGVVISYPLCHCTLILGGWHLSLLHDPQPWRVLFQVWPFLVLNTAIAFLVQYTVMSVRQRQWALAIPTKRLAIACLLAKLISTFLWLWFVRMLNPL